MKFLIFVLLFSLSVKAALPPTSLSGGNSSSTAKTTFFTQVPFNQATQVSGVTGRIETGSENILPNPNFEAKVLNWITFLGTGTVQNTTSSPIAEKQSMEIIDGGTGGYTVATSGSVAIPGGFSGINGQFFCRFKNKLTSSVTIFMSAQDNGANVLGSVTFTLPGAVSAPVNQLQGFNFIYNTTMTAITPLVQVVTGAGDVLVDDCYVGPALNLGFVIPTALFRYYGTNTFNTGTKGATPVIDQIGYSQYGDSAHVIMNYKQTNAGTAGSGDYQVTLPNGIQFAASVTFYTAAIGSNVAWPSTSCLGMATISDGTSQGVGCIIPFDATHFRIAFTYATGTGSNRGSWNSGLFPLSSNPLSVTADFIAPMAGFSGSVTALNPTCNLDGSCVNVFSASVSSAGVITNANVPGWLASCPSSGPYACTFATGLFGATPNCIAEAAQIGPAIPGTYSASTTGVTATFINGVGANQNQPFILTCVRGASDIRPVQANIVSGVLAYGNAGVKKIWDFEFDNGTYGSACASGSCTVRSNENLGLTMSVGTTGLYTSTITSGICSTVPVCTSNAFDAGNKEALQLRSGSSWTTSSMLFVGENASGAANVSGHIRCSCN